MTADLLCLSMAALTWDLSIGMHVPLSEEHHELLLGEVQVHHGERYHVEGQVPGGVLKNGQTDAGTGSSLNPMG